MELTKQYIITHKNGVTQNIDLNNTGRCFPGEGFIGAEFETKEELDAYITSNKLITREEAIETMIAYRGEEEVDIEQCMFDDDVSLNVKILLNRLTEVCN